MGITPSCPNNTILQSDGCYDECPVGSSPSVTYANLCISTIACPSGTDVDTTGLACTKVSRDSGWVPKVGESCDTGYTEWAPNTCYKNCPNDFLENAFDCRKITTERQVQPAVCEIGTRFVNGNCELETVKLGVLAVVIYVSTKWYIEETIKTFK